MNPISVIGPQFISPDAQEIIVDTCSIGTLVITDTNHKILIKVKPCDTSFHRQRVLLDANDQPVVTIREKNMSLHDRWRVYKGESHADSDLIFRTKIEHVIHFKTNIKVLLENRVSKDDCDFSFKGSWSKRNCNIYIGDSSTTIAHMHALKPLENMKHCKDKFMVTINPNVDYAFVVAIIAIVDALKNIDPQLIVAGVGVGGGVGGAIGSC